MAKRKKGFIMKDEALRRYYDKSSSLEEGRAMEPVAMSFPKPRKLVALRLDEHAISRIRHLAAEKGLNYSTLMRMWITERLRQERP